MNFIHRIIQAMFASGYNILFISCKVTRQKLALCDFLARSMKFSLSVSLLSVSQLLPFSSVQVVKYIDIGLQSKMINLDTHSAENWNYPYYSMWVFYGTTILSPKACSKQKNPSKKNTVKKYISFPNYLQN